MAGIGIAGADGKRKELTQRGGPSPNRGQYRSGVSVTENIRGAGSGQREQVDVEAAIGVTALGNVIGLPKEVHPVDQCPAIGAIQNDPIAIFAEREVNVEVGPVRIILFGLVIGPNQQEAASRDHILAIHRDP